MVDKIKSKISGVALTADIIVGFPGETEEDFLDTIDVVQKVSFDNSYMFMYSIRKGTKAATMDNQIEESVKKERLQRLMEVQNKCSFYESSKYKDRIVKVFSGMDLVKKIKKFYQEELQQIRLCFLKVNFKFKRAICKCKNQ